MVPMALSFPLLRPICHLSATSRGARMQHALKGRALNRLSLHVFLSNPEIIKRRKLRQRCPHNQSYHPRIACDLPPSPGGSIRLSVLQHKYGQIRSMLPRPLALPRRSKARHLHSSPLNGPSHQAMEMLLSKRRIALHSNQDSETPLHSLLPLPCLDQSDFRHYHQRAFSSKTRVCSLWGRN